MTESVDNQVRGRAVYFEFVRPGELITTQVLLLPEGVTTSHRTVPMTMYRRRLSPMQPRKTWKMTAATCTAEQARRMAGSTDEKDVAAAMLSFMTPLFKSLTTNQYALYKQPIVIEVTAEDLELARLGKTPYKALARVWKTRKKLGFPKEYIHKEEAAAAAI